LNPTASNVTAWRIATDTRRYEADDLSGAGAKDTEGRWHEVGDGVVYASETRSLACLETLVHLDAGGLPLNRYLVAITIPNAVWARARTAAVDRLPVGWDAEPAGRASVRFGSAWLRSMECAVLRVPSVIVQDEFNVLINPLHADSSGVTAAKVRRWAYDARLR
jgi:RES domain-containing protein